MAQRIVGALGGWLTPAYAGSLCLDIDLDDIPALASEQDTLWSRLTSLARLRHDAATFLTPDEKRSAAGYGPMGSPVSPESDNQKFNPGQPRAPSGRPNGGQWTKPGGDSGGDGGGAAGDSSTGNDNGDSGNIGELGSGLGDRLDTPLPDFGESVDAPTLPRRDNERPRQVADRIDDKYNVVLSQEENNGGHTIRDHVGKSDAYLVSEVESNTYELRGSVVAGKLKESTFVSVESANDFVNRTLKRNIEKVDRVASGQSDYEILNARFGYPTGKEANRDTVVGPISIRDTYEVRVMIKHDSRSLYGYQVFTAFPYNRIPK